jgi:teichoic acid transport system ATP-binding protein
MKELISDSHRTVIIVSHSMSTLRELCDEILWINDGEQVEIGATEEVIARYEEFMN